MMVSSGDFRVYMRQLAGWVWKEQTAAHSFSLSLQEETITEVLLLEMAKTLSPLGLNVTMFSKAQEGGRTKKVISTLPDGTDVETQVVDIEAEGADWEWFVKSPDGCMASFRIQAKKLYHDIPTRKGRYGGFHAAGAQIDTLITRANAIGSNPIYVLYNHPDVTDANLFGPTRQPDFFGRDCWGCAVTTAQFMKHARDNKLQTIHRGTVPWHRFFGIGKPCRTRAAINEIADELVLDTGDSPQEFVEATEMPRWVEMLSSSEDLVGYLREQSLDGVALLDFSDFGGK
jgi:hypothetical protein